MLSFFLGAVMFILFGMFFWGSLCALCVIAGFSLS